jgi:hypothetical protein
MSESQNIVPIQSLQIKGVLTFLNVLESCGYETLNQLAAADDLTLMKIRGMGPSVLARFKEAAKFHGIPWTGKPHKPIPLGPVIKLKHNAGSMTLRDYFAAQAMTALVPLFKQPVSLIVISNNAYAMADVMLKQRELKKNHE